MFAEKPTVVTLSWDDGYRADTKVLKLMNKYNLKGTFYVSLDRQGFDIISEQQIRQIAKYQEIGAHTMTHPRLTQIPPKNAKQEILQSKKLLEEITKKEINSFSYPFGSYDDRIKFLVKNAGFTIARTTRRFCFDFKDPFEIGVTVDAYPRNPLGNLLYLAKSNLTGVNFFLNHGFSTDWMTLAKKTFDFACKNGGIWHMVGHSLEIETSDLWKELETVFKYISRKNAKYVTNKDLVYYDFL